MKLLLKISLALPLLLGNVTQAFGNCEYLGNTQTAKGPARDVCMGIAIGMLDSNCQRADRNNKVQGKVCRAALKGKSNQSTGPGSCEDIDLERTGYQGVFFQKRWTIDDQSVSFFRSNVCRAVSDFFLQSTVRTTNPQYYIFQKRVSLASYGTSLAYTLTGAEMLELLNLGKAHRDPDELYRQVSALEIGQRSSLSLPIAFAAAEYTNTKSIF
jgi:hypothetical protein